MNFIKKLFEDKPDDECHRQLKRYGKGIYEDKALLDINKSKKNVKIKSSFEFAYDFVKLLAATIKDRTKVTGVIITTKDISNELSFHPAGISQFAGVKSIKVDNELSKDDILKSIANHPDALFLLSFSTDYGSLKTKPKSPRAAKPSNKEGEEAKADFCTFITADFMLLEDFVFESRQNFKHAFIKHKLEINEVVYPEEYENDFAKIRELGKRTGIITREAIIEGNKIISKHNFSA